MKLTLKSSSTQVIGRELADWGKIFQDNETSVGEKIFKGW